MGEGKDVDPNWYFGVYSFLIFILLVASIFLNRDLEPEIVLRQREKDQRLERRIQMMAEAMGMPIDDEEMPLIEFESSHDSAYNETLCHSCSRTFSQVCYLFKFKEWYLPIAFFLVQGILIPNFDDLHYMFLTEIVGMPKYEYDFLNIITYVGILFFVLLYNKCFPGAQVWVLILVSLFLFIIMTSLMLINAMRVNIEWGISDEVINGIIFFIGT
jgi:hypothetical protein